MKIEQLALNKGYELEALGMKSVGDKKIRTATLTKDGRKLIVDDELLADIADSADNLTFYKTGEAAA